MRRIALIAPLLSTSPRWTPAADRRPPPDHGQAVALARPCPGGCEGPEGLARATAAFAATKS